MLKSFARLGPKLLSICSKLQMLKSFARLGAKLLSICTKLQMLKCFARLGAKLLSICTELQMHQNAFNKREYHSGKTNIQGGPITKGSNNQGGSSNQGSPISKGVHPWEPIQRSHPREPCTGLQWIQLLTKGPVTEREPIHGSPSAGPNKYKIIKQMKKYSGPTQVDIQTILNDCLSSVFRISVCFVFDFRISND